MSIVIASLAGTALGRYRLVEKLGSGGMATVYRADDPTLGRQVAVKVMHPFIAARSEAGSRFEREAKAVAGLRHPNVMALHDYAPASGDHPAYLVMELLTGPSLQRFMGEHGAPLAEVAAMLGLRIAQALGAAHARGVVHRDVKPENVMFDGHRVVLCDFGIARVAAADGVTATGAVLGSPAYMSPEQASGAEIDARSDQFSLGALLYQLATGGLPFSGTSPLVTMAKIVKGDHAPPTAKNPRVPPYLERVIERLLRTAPDQRFPSVDACAEALRDGLTADGFGDVDVELAAYLRDPAAYNAAAEGRIVDAARAQADAARARGETARALGAANRVLAWRPDDARALALTAGLSARPRRVAMLVAAVAFVVAGAGAIGWRMMHVRELSAVS
ncbi:MAG TPA: serine/threonine-protein kinase, partial [Polyangia bacterium]